MKTKTLLHIEILLCYTLTLIFCVSCNQKSVENSVRIVTELNIGESQDIKLSNGNSITLKLLHIEEICDSLRNAVRASKVKISIDGEEFILNSGNYNLPVTVGKVQIDCPVIDKIYPNSVHDRWGLIKNARFRLWPKGSAYIEPGTFVYPIKQVWFASMTQSGNEPTYVDWGENPSNKKIYYHSGHDIGGAEGMDEIISSTNGLVLASNNELLPGYDSIPVYVHPDAVNVLDKRGWLVEYAHLDSIIPAIKPGVMVKMGQKIGYIGKQGSSGGWVHLHFQIVTKYPFSGKWGIEDPYPYVWESYVNQYKPPILAVARPHHISWTGREIILDGSKSKSFNGEIVNYEWEFCDGTSASGAMQKKSYKTPGEYSEILKVTDSKGYIDYDFAVVQVFDRENQQNSIPVIQAAYHPTLDIKVGDPVTFLVRTFNSNSGNEIWDFGDSSAQVSVKSGPIPEDSSNGKFAETVHSFTKPGHYIVKVERSNEQGFKAIAHLHVMINK